MANQGAHEMGMGKGMSEAVRVEVCAKPAGRSAWG